jgi:hypothetical protein
MVFRLTKSWLGMTAGRWNARRSVTRPSPFSLTGSNGLVIPRNINFSGTLDTSMTCYRKASREHKGRAINVHNPPRSSFIYAIQPYPCQIPRSYRVCLHVRHLARRSHSASAPESKFLTLQYLQLLPVRKHRVLNVNRI